MAFTLAGSHWLYFGYTAKNVLIDITRYLCFAFVYSSFVRSFLCGVNSPIADPEVR